MKGHHSKQQHKLILGTSANGGRQKKPVEMLRRDSLKMPESFQLNPTFDIQNPKVGPKLQFSRLSANLQNP